MIDDNGKKRKIIFIMISIIVICLFITLIVYVENRSYINNIDFRLNGSQVTEIEVGIEWKDPSVIAIRNGKNLIHKVETTGNVNYLVPGQYKITYIMKKGFYKKELTRIVIVKNKNDNFILNLKGNSIIYISKGKKYNEPGYIATYNNLDVTREVIITGNVNFNAVGDYTLKYSITKDGYVREKIRLVKVVDFNYKFESNIQNKITFTTSDVNYSHIVLPDGTTSYSRNVTYDVKKNGEYSFTIYNKLGFVESHIVKVYNADISAPTGTCVAYLYDNYTNVVVDAKDDGEIAGYEYIYGNKKSSVIAENQFKYNDNINSVNVNIYDKSNHKTNVKCSVNDKSSAVPSSYKSYTFNDTATSRTMKYWLYIPDNLTTRNSVPLMIYLHGDGGRSDDIKKVNNHSYPKFISEGSKYPFMMVAAQINYETNWTNESTYKRLMRLVEYIIDNYNVNTKKIILAGGSSGGGGAYKITSEYPNYFSCTVIGSGMYDSVYRNFASKLTNTPMWVFHGTNDTNISYSSVKSFSEYINSLGGNVKFVSVEGGTHGVTETNDGFKNQELINWMLKQERK